MLRRITLRLSFVFQVRAPLKTSLRGILIAVGGIPNLLAVFSLLCRFGNRVRGHGRELCAAEMHGLS